MMASLRRLGYLQIKSHNQNMLQLLDFMVIIYMWDIVQKVVGIHWELKERSLHPLKIYCMSWIINQHWSYINDI